MPGPRPVPNNIRRLRGQKQRNTLKCVDLPLTTPWFETCRAHGTETSHDDTHTAPAYPRALRRNRITTIAPMTIRMVLTMMFPFRSGDWFIARLAVSPALL